MLSLRVFFVKNLLSSWYSRGIQIEVCWIPAHVGIPGNEKADEKAKSGITCPIYDVKLPVGDYIGSLKNNLKLNGKICGITSL